MGAFFYKSASFLVNHLPLEFCYRLAVRIGDIYCLFARSNRRAIKSNLTHIFNGNIDKKKLNFYIRQTFREFSKYLVEFLFFPQLSVENIDRFIKIENADYIEEALKNGNGVIILTAHFGNWELGGITMGLKGYPISAVALDHRDSEVNRFFLNQRKSKGENIIRLGFGMRQCFDILRENKILALVGDRDFNHSETGLKVNFCGQETLSCIPMGAAKLALKTGAAIVPGFVVRDEKNMCRLTFSPSLKITETGNKEKDIKSIMEDFFNVFKKHILQYPYLWFLFRPLWEEIK